MSACKGQEVSETKEVQMQGEVCKEQEVKETKEVQMQMEACKEQEVSETKEVQMQSEACKGQEIKETKEVQMQMEACKGQEVSEKKEVQMQMEACKEQEKKAENESLQEVKKMRLAGDDLVPIIKEVLACGGEFPLTVTGTSMTPTLKDGRDQVRLVSPATRLARKGEVVFFQRTTGEYVLHRISRELTDGKLEINGDAQNWFETIEPSQIIAVVSEICRKGRWISCDSFPYRLYCRIWTGLRPMRPWILRIRRIPGKIRRMLGR